MDDEGDHNSATNDSSPDNTDDDDDDNAMPMTAIRRTAMTMMTTITQ